MIRWSVTGSSQAIHIFVNIVVANKLSKIFPCHGICPKNARENAWMTIFGETHSIHDRAILCWWKPSLPLHNMGKSSIYVPRPSITRKCHVRHLSSPYPGIWRICFYGFSVGRVPYQIQFPISREFYLSKTWKPFNSISYTAQCKRSQPKRNIYKWVIVFGTFVLCLCRVSPYARHARCIARALHSIIWELWFHLKHVVLFRGLCICHYMHWYKRFWKRRKKRQRSREVRPSILLWVCLLLLTAHAKIMPKSE